MMQQHITYQGNLFLLYCRSGLLFILVLAFTIVMAFLVLTVGCLCDILRFKLSIFWAHCVLFLVKSICGINYHVTGLENITKTRNAIVLCKHQSAWETIYLTTVLPSSCILLKKSLLWIPFWGWAMATLKPIAINRSTPKQALKQLLQQGAKRLQQGYWIVIYPEGTRVAPGEQRKFSASGSLLAQRTGTPVIPVAHNAGEFWSRNSFLKYPGIIQVKIGPVITAGQRKSKAINAEVESWINTAMNEIEATKQSHFKQNL